MIRIVVPGKPRNRKATDEQVITAYEALGSCSAAAKALGMCAQSVHERLVKLGANKPQNSFSEDDRARLVRDYDDYVQRGELATLASEMGRTRHFLCKKARALGLTDKTRPMPAKAKALVAASAKERIARDGHPRGMAGKSHSPETREHLSKTSRGFWGAMSAAELSAHADKTMLTKIARGIPLAGTNQRGSWKAGWRDVGGKRNYYRSRWEANYARYLEWLKQQRQIQDWQHEPETFWFEKIKRGVRSYLPDFRVWENDGNSKLHEVKGWMDARSKTTLARMKRYHPAETIILIRERDYNAIARAVSGMIDGWEHSERRGRL